MFNQHLTLAQIELRNNKMMQYAGYALMLSLTACLFLVPEAHAAGLEKPKTLLQKFTDEILPVLRLVAVLALMLAGAGYMMNMLDKSVFVKIIVGILIIVGASEFVGFMWGGS